MDAVFDKAYVSYLRLRQSGHGKNHHRFQSFMDFVNAEQRAWDSGEASAEWGE